MGLWRNGTDKGIAEVAERIVLGTSAGGGGFEAPALERGGPVLHCYGRDIEALCRGLRDEEYEGREYEKKWSHFFGGP